ncbi:MAG: 1-acyl-sn-glycerol-3-phosphate acyltransferase [Desulfobaccales bacterium]|nr:1-acyl-sn-glycerol-3-phosphate acyltransferase [Desulfobaccales bacterium]
MGLESEAQKNHSVGPTGPEKPRSWLGRLVSRLSGCLGGHEYHYAGYLPSRPGFLLRFTLDPFFSRVTVNPKYLERLQKLADQGAVVYALKYRSHLDFLFFNRRYQKLGARAPEVAFDLNLWMWQPFSHLLQIITTALNYFTRRRAWPNPFQDDYFKRTLEENRGSLLFLVDQVGFRQRFLKPREDPIRHLLELQEQLDFPIFIIPQMVMYEKDPEKEYKGLFQLFFGDSENPGKLRKLGLCFLKARQAVVELAEPVNLKEVLATAPQEGRLRDLAQEIRRELIRRIDLKRRQITGPVIKSREEFLELTLTDPGLTGFMEHLAETEKKKLPKIKNTAQDYFWEIAADFNIFYVNIMNRSINRLCQHLFDGIAFDEAGFEKVRDAGQKGNLIFVPCHKSHLDYLILNHLIYQHHMHPPRIAAGKNLAFWPLGAIFRGSGAFFIRRRFLGGKLYAEVLYTYLKTLITTGYNLEFFIEGRRSRTGKLVLPKLGLLNMILRTYDEQATPDLLFVPTFIGYDQVLEEKAYLKELEGREKETESMGQLMKARKFLKHRYGRAYIQFSEPISIKQYLAHLPPPAADEPPYQAREHGQDLAYRIIQAINRISVVTPFSLVCAALLTYPRKGVYRRELLQIIRVLFDYLQAHKVPLADSLENLTQAVEDTLAQCEIRKLITPIEKEEGLADELGLGGYSIDETKRPLLEYYKNNILHFFLPASLVSLAILAGVGFEFEREQVLSDFSFLSDFFKNEFIFNDIDPEGQVEEILGYFSSRGVVINLDQPTRYTLSASGLKELSYFANLLYNYLESYWIVFRSIKYLQKKPRSEREFLKRIQSIGAKLHKLGEVERAEALSEATFQNALKLFGEKGIVLKQSPEGKGATTFARPPDEDAKEFYGRQLARFLRR